MLKVIIRKSLVFAIISVFVGTSFALNISNGENFDDVPDQYQTTKTGSIGGFEFRVAQSFKPTLNKLTRVELLAEKTGSPYGDLTISIRRYLNGDDYTSITMLAQDISPDGDWYEFDFSDISVIPEETYYILWTPDSDFWDSDNLIVWGCNWYGNLYTRGEMWNEYPQGYWYIENPEWDCCFKTYGYNYVNQPPNAPTIPDPEDGAIDVVVDPILSVYVSDPDGDSINVKFYDASDNSYIGGDHVSNNSRAYHDWKNLRPLTTYSWYAIADDGEYTVQSDTWEFTTGIENNNPPTVPIINGPASGKPGNKYYYTFISTDPNDHDVYYEVDWGDGTFDTSGPHQSNVLTHMDHTWDESGNYTIRARAKDVYGEYSDWGTFEVSIPRNRILANTLLLGFLEKFLLLERLLLNLRWVN